FTGTLRALNQMTSVLFNTGGEITKLYSDRPVGLAAGYEYRFLSGENVPDPITVAGETTGNAAQITSGHYYVNEGYAELSIPDVTVRGTYATGFRAPSISDLFLGQADSFPNVSDPCRGQGVAGGGSPPPQCLAQGLPASGTGDAQTQLRAKIGGNPTLQPET